MAIRRLGIRHGKQGLTQRLKQGLRPNRRRGYRRLPPSLGWMVAWGLLLLLLWHSPSLAQSNSLAQTNSPDSVAPTSQIQSTQTEAPSQQTRPNEGLPWNSSQFKLLNNLFQSNSQLQTTWIRLDGQRLFQIAGFKPGLAERRQTIQNNLNRLVQDYLNTPEVELQVEIESINRQPVIRVNGQSLFTVTNLDAQFHSMEPELWAEQLQSILQGAIATAKTQRTPQFLQGQIIKATMLLFMALLLSLGLRYGQHRIRTQPIRLLDPSTSQLIKQQSRRNQSRVQEVKYFLLTTTQISLWLSLTLGIPSLFPQTRPWTTGLLGILKIPLVLAGTGLVSYLLLRLSDIAIDRFSLLLSSNPLLPSDSSERTQQRISTVSQVVKGLVFLAIALVGLISALAILGVNVGPLLAGAGLLGVGLSLASQGIIKDAINGFLIVFEDQYGVGDIIQIGEWTGLVETLNLRMTQLRNSEGKLITIPNSEVKIVANLSSYWSRVDLNIPVPYEADLDKMMVLIEQTALTMVEDSSWGELILEPPQLMGVEDFSDRGLILKLWIKTQPLKQWDVAREYRRRLKLALDEQGIEIPIPQRAFWLHSTTEPASMQGQQ